MTVFGRFGAKYEHGTSDECWNWTGNTNRGYGMLKQDGRQLYAHRLAWEFINGEVPDGMVIMHKCDNPSCVNPAHLEAGSMKENMEHRDERDRAVTGPDSPMAKLSDEDGLEIRQEYNTTDKTMSDLAEKYDTSDSTISHIVNGNKRWSWLDE